MVLGKTSNARRSTNSDKIVGHGPTALAVGAGGGLFDILSLVCQFPLPLGDGPI